jgi:hypothetical protein
MMSRDANGVCHSVDAYAGQMGGEDPHGDAQHGPSSATAGELHDTALHEEIELVGQLVVAATTTPHRLSQDEIDKVLGVETED